MSKKQDAKNKYEPFLRKAMDADHKYIPFDQLKMSTVTMVVKLVDDCNIKFNEMINYVPIIPAYLQHKYPKHQWPAGSIMCIKFGGEVRGVLPTDSDRNMKNSTTLWIWLEEKIVNVKVSAKTLHITGCKNLDQTAETARLIRQHLELLYEQGIKLFDEIPYASEFNVCMINYNFNLGVALDLSKFDIFIAKEFGDILYSPYDPNIHGTTMPLKCEQLSMTYTLHDNGQICMCVRIKDVTRALINDLKGHEIFFIILNAFRDANNLCQV